MTRDRCKSRSVLGSAVNSNLNLICQNFLLVENKKKLGFMIDRVQAVTFIILLLGVFLKKNKKNVKIRISDSDPNFGFWSFIQQ